MVFSFATIHMSRLATRRSPIHGNGVFATAAIPKGERLIQYKGKLRSHDEVDRAYPARWIGKVTVETTDGRRFDGRVDEPKGDPGNTLSPAEIEDKAVRLARYRGGASEAEARRAIAAIRTLASTPRVPRFLA